MASTRTFLEMIARRSRAPSFFWQGCLILLPLVVLTVLGLASLRHDRRLATEEVERRAQALANDLANSVWTRVASVGWNSVLLTSPFSDSQNVLQFSTDQEGRLVSPAPYSAIPTPRPLALETLSARERAAWDRLFQDTAGPSLSQSDLDQTGAILLNPALSSNLLALVHFRLAMLSMNQMNWTPALGHFDTVLSRFPYYTTESGIDLRSLIYLKKIDLSVGYPGLGQQLSGEAIEGMCSNIVRWPSVLTPAILQAVKNADQFEWKPALERWLEVWNRDERTRRIHAAAARQWLTSPERRPWLASAGPSEKSPAEPGLSDFLVSSNYVYWVTEENPWLVSYVKSEGSNHVFICRSEAEIRSVARSIGEQELLIPQYFSASLDLLGQSVLVCSNTVEAPLAHSAMSLPIRAQLFFTNPTLFYAAQSRRTVWGGSVIAVSALAVLVGFFKARAAFKKQLHLSEMKSNFVSSVSHELRAPIASVRLMAEGLQSGRVTDASKQRQYFAFIVQECRRLSSLIENVLDFSRIEQGRKQYDLEPTDLVSVVRQTVALMEPAALEKGITLETHLSGDAAPVEVDGRAIQQALINLIDNAIKHSPRGTRTTAGIDFEQSKVELWVEDQGEGIPAEEHEKIFERFYRLGSELRRETQGVGIGLSIVKHVVEAHRGRVIVRSSLGQGSRFTIILPRNSDPSHLI